MTKRKAIGELANRDGIEQSLFKVNSIKAFNADKPGRFLRCVQLLHIFYFSFG
jgi:hypothetical protein